MGRKKISYFNILSFLLLISAFSIYSQIGGNVVGSNSAQTNSITLPQGNIYYCVAASDSGVYPILISNTQNIPTPSPFQQDIAICNGTINIGPNFAYINNATLFNQINPNGQNVYFVNSSGNILYSWYEGQENFNGIYCDVWWVNIPNGISANSNITIYMNVGPNSANYYFQYYPYVGVSPQVISGYDNGQNVFIAYGYFNNTFDGWSGYIYNGSFSPTATPYGIEMLNDSNNEGTYILPPNNGNIPEIPLIVEEAWYYSNYFGANIIALFGNTNNQVNPYNVGGTGEQDASVSNSSTFEESYMNYAYIYLESAVTNQVLNYIFSSSLYNDQTGTVYSYLVVSSSYAETGYYYYNSNQVWAPLTLLDTYTYNVYNPTNINNGISGYTYSNLNYNPYQYPTLEISGGVNYDTLSLYEEWVVARAYPPNDIMPIITIGSSSTLPLSKSSGWYAITITNTQSQATPTPFQQDIAICNGTFNIGNNFAYINNATLFNEIDSDGQNVYFTTTNNSNPNIYSWYEGQLNYNGVYCDVWWINISQGIPANSNVTIYIDIGSYNDYYYRLYYPYVGVSPQVISRYDNGQDVFIAYGYFDNTFDGWSGYWSGISGTTYYVPQATSNGIEMIDDVGSEGTYILPPNNGNIPEIPLIVEEAWYYGGGGQNADANVIALFGNTSQQIIAGDVVIQTYTWGGQTPTSNLSTFVQFEYFYYRPAANLISAVTSSLLNYTSFPTSGGTVYSYLIVNSSYLETGYYIYNSNQVWVPLTILDTYNINNNGYTYSNLNYNPYQYPTLEISAGTGGASSYQYEEWVVARSYPPNGIMPSIYIG